MIEGLDITSHSFGTDVNYVVVKMDIGKMTPNRAKRYIERARESMKLFRLLDSNGIDYDVIGVRNANDITIEAKSEAPEVPNHNGENLVKFRQEFMTKLAHAATEIKESAKRPIPTEQKETVTANRSDILKTNLNDDLKKDSFADAMKLVE